MEGELTARIVLLVLQLSVILFLAKIFGELTERFLKQPSVLGELLIGIVIGPYALGSHIKIPHFGVLFPNPQGGLERVPLSPELYAMAQIAVIILLFVAGLETDLKAFLRYARPATLIATGGVIFPFILGDLTVVFMGYGKGFMDPHALFMGAALTATSVGITARILSDMGKLNTPEGVTILAGAVVDDVLGILVLAIVVSIGTTGAVSFGEVSWIAVRAFGIWVILMVVGILTANWVVKTIRLFRTEGAWIALVFALGLFYAAIAEAFGLAMIIGAYAIGLSLSKTKMAEEMREHFISIYHALVPIFFVVMGMLVNLKATTSAIMLGVVLTLVAILGKVLGCGLPALMVGFNSLGGARIGIGMLPRGEVALIVAGIAITAGVISPEMYGVAVLMTMITTLMAPILLVPLFKKKGTGLKALKDEEIYQKEA